MEQIIKIISLVLLLCKNRNDLLTTEIFEFTIVVLCFLLGNFYWLYIFSVANRNLITYFKIFYGWFTDFTLATDKQIEKH